MKTWFTKFGRNNEVHPFAEALLSNIDRHSAWRLFDTGRLLNKSPKKNRAINFLINLTEGKAVYVEADRLTPDANFILHLISNGKDEGIILSKGRSAWKMVIVLMDHLNGDDLSYREALKTMSKLLDQEAQTIEMEVA